MKLKNGKEVVEVEIKFFNTYSEAKEDKNYFKHTIDKEGIYYPPSVIVNSLEYHPVTVSRNIPVKPYSAEETVYVRGAN